MAFKTYIAKLLHNTIYKERTFYLLNHLTLEVSNDECRKALARHKTQQIALLLTPAIVSILLYYLFNLAQTFMVVGYHPMHAISNAFICLGVLVVIYLRWKNLLQHLEWVMLLCFLAKAFSVVCVYQEWLPKSFK